MITLYWQGSKFQGANYKELVDALMQDPRQHAIDWEELVARVQTGFSMPLPTEPEAFFNELHARGFVTIIKT